MQNVVGAFVHLCHVQHGVQRMGLKLVDVLDWKHNETTDTVCKALVVDKYMAGQPWKDSQTASVTDTPDGINWFSYTENLGFPFLPNFGVYDWELFELVFKIHQKGIVVLFSIFWFDFV